MRKLKPEWFAGRLKELRQAKGWTQMELAIQAALSLGGIQQLEGGRSLPRYEILLKLCEVFGVTPDAFIVEPAEVAAAGPGRPKPATVQAENKTDEPAEEETPLPSPKKQKAKG